MANLCESHLTEMATTGNGYREKDPRFATRAIHVGSEPEQWSSRATVPPIIMASTFKQLINAGPHFHYEYSRTKNPGRVSLERCLAALDDAEHALAFASPFGAIISVVNLLSAGDHMLIEENVYGETRRYCADSLPSVNISTTFADGVNAETFCHHLKPTTKMVWLETPSNPLMKVVDIPRIASLIKAYNKDIIIVIDNSILTSYFQNPLALGGDIVIYAVSNYFNGHSDVVMGAITTNNDDYFKRLYFTQRSVGIVPSPFDCYLVIRSLKTMKLRMEKHMKNGLAVAVFLEKHPLIEKVNHPGLPSHPQHELALRLWSGCSGTFSFYLRGGLTETKAFLSALKIFTLAVSFGGTKSLADHPQLMTASEVSKDEMRAMGITDNLVRLSVGLEYVEDLIQDLDQALQVCSNADFTRH